MEIIYTRFCTSHRMGCSKSQQTTCRIHQHSTHRETQASKMCRRSFPWTSCLFILPVLLQFLLTFAQGQGHGMGNIEEGSLPPVDDRVYFEIQEELRPGILVGTIPTLDGLTYSFSDEPVEFTLDSTSGQIRTKIVIDRERLSKDTFDLFVQSTPSARHLIEVQIKVLDINDNSPLFGQRSVEVMFSERDQPGSQAILDTAIDADIDANDVTTDYKIISGNRDGRFRLVLLKDTSIPLLYLENTVELNREERDSYQLRISVTDGGEPPRYGFLQINITVRDFNDNQPVFDQSYYSTQMNETSPPGTSVIQVRATDQDIGPNADITYQIITDDYNQFAIDALTGVVTSTKRLHCQHTCDSAASSSNCKPNSCFVTVEARDRGGLSGRAYITINLMDENDHAPVIRFQYFSQTPHASLDESANEGDIVAFVSVIDQDDSTNGQTIVWIIHGNDLGHFRLVSNNLQSNLLTVVGPIDREKVHKYNLTFEAHDLGSPPRRSTAFLVIMINDINDHAPVFQQKTYRRELGELTPLGSFAASITAMDNDTGINAEIVYTIISGNDLGWFKIDGTTGLVTTQMSLDRETATKVVLQIQATDGATEPFSVRTNLTIAIWDENDEVPAFDPSEYSVRLVEGAGPGTEIITLTAVDHDEGRNGSITYSFTPETLSTYPSLLYLNQISGRISLDRSLDREEFSSVVIKVKASDQGSPSLSSTATVTIYVQDLNDNAPVFYPQTYYTRVLENQPPATKVIQVLASDPDAGENGTVYYTITDGSYQKFSINIVTGVISTRSGLDREQRGLYTLTVTARDAGYKYADISAVVEVAVADIQDTPPVFAQNAYTFSIIEDDGRQAPVIGRTVGSVSATTKDESGVVTYVISGGDPEGRFTIDSNSGEISTAAMIDREITASYQIEVTAIGGQNFGVVMVSVTIVDINDNVPSFDNGVVEVYVVENWPVGHSVHVAKARDDDDGNNGLLQYSLTSDSSTTFEINPDTAMITLAASLQYVQGSTFDVTVVVRDLGSPSLSSTQSVHIAVMDINDHTPLFEKVAYEVSINEAQPVNDRFFRVMATDDDVGPNGDVSFHIARGNDDGRFGIFPDGVLYISKVLDREAKDMYVLTIKAIDSGVEPRSSRTNLTIRVLDDNDNAPQFVNDTFHFYLEEGSHLLTSVGKVAATDSDSGLNAELSYRIDGEHKGFSLHPKTGILSSVIQHDRERLIESSGSADIQLSVIATDTGKDSLHSKVQVYVHVTDVNDNRPVFTQPMYEATLLEDIAVYTPVLRVSATDDDAGENSAITYVILHGNEQGRFSIEDSTGQISIAESLDREIIVQYTLTVMAYDGGMPSLNVTVDVRILIEDVNDHAPAFLQDGQRIQIVETAEVGEYITKVSATDNDLSNNAFLSYRIAGGNTDTTFRIDANNGNIYLANVLDYERRNYYVLNITVHDAGEPQLGSSRELAIEILDYNDNEPQFSSSPIVRQIQEGVVPTTTVGTITATDPDHGANGWVKYSIRTQEPGGDHFDIDPETGMIRTSADIDREFAESFRLYVVATDQAQPVSTRKSAEKIVTIFVGDINDNSPKFVSMNAVPVNVGAQPDTFILTVTAEDPDAQQNGEVVYEIFSGDKNMFRIDSLTGRLHLKSALNSQVLTYDLSIQARDRGASDRLGEKSTISQLTVFTRSSSEVGPQFAQASYSSQVYENEPSGTSIITVSVNQGARSGADVEYYLTKVSADDEDQKRIFQVNPTSGMVSTTEPLDRETGYDLYEVEVYAVDRSSNTAQTRKAVIQITLLDKNDSPPVFASSLYSFSVAEDVVSGHEVTRLSALDADLQGVTVYSITEGAEGKFSINPSTGILQVLNKLNREVTPSYNVKVTADDGVQSSSTMVHIEVTDVNDESPVFDQPSYYFDVLEDTPLSSTIGHVSASDADEGSNSEITYSISSHWGREKFSLDPHDGIFTLNGDLDFEEIEHYVLTVKAQDSGNPSLSSTVTVYMNVIDVNDNSPVFDLSSYNTELWENATIYTSVLTVGATDLDSGVNADLQFSIVGGNTDGHFGVELETGVIYVAEDLDRELIPIYIIEVQATDMPTDPSDTLSSIALVTVILQDVNDNPPEFTSPSVISVMESLPVGSTLDMSISADDRDEDRNSLVEYHLDTSGEQLFQIDRLSGSLKTKVAFDREAIPEYVIGVTAKDQGIPSLSTTMSMTVVVGDSNDHSPVFDPKAYTLVVPEDISLGTALLQVFATDDDKDSNAQMLYTMVEGDDFYLDTHVGELSVKEHLDYETEQVHNLVIVVQDLPVGEASRSDTATITITVTDINDYVPLFDDSPYMAYVQENTANLPVHVVQVMASDYDSPTNAQLTYFLDEGESLFMMNSSTGIITAHQTLDREIREQYELIVTAVDSGSPRLTGTGTVTVLVVDDNDNSPQFQYAQYTAHIQENQPAGTELLHVYATDRDDGRNADISYSLLEDGAGMFDINSVTGRVFSTSELNRESMETYSLVVMATDDGSLPRSSMVTVSVVVLDANDNSPLFERTIYNVYMQNPTTIGTFVVGVLATDLDRDENADVVYSLLDDHFNIDSDRGVITARSNLSSAVAPNGYYFPVRATDKGQNPLLDEKYINITFLPADSTNFPLITSNERTFQLDESRQVGLLITTVTAISPTGAAITYHIAGGNTEQSFTLDTVTGDLALREPLDYEVVQNYNLWVEARDDASPPLSAYVMLNVDVLDQNDNWPVFDYLYYNASVLENIDGHQNILRVTATDADSGGNGHVTFKITAGNDANKFGIDSDLGDIYTTVALDRETLDLYQLVVVASDNGDVKKSATATVDVKVLDDNDIRPTFQYFYGAGTPIPEDSAVGDFVVKATCIDRDIYPNDIITYAMASHAKFEIDVSSGNITVISQLDREDKDSYTLDVLCSDGTYQSKTQVVIDIVDVNDNAPQFSPSSYSFSLVEDEPEGTFIGNVHATDRDLPGPNSQVYYRLKDSDPNSALFKVDSHTGNITSRVPFTYQTVTYRGFSENQYEMTILGIDKADTDTRLQSEVKVKVDIKPANRHAPQFDLTQYDAPVVEDAVIGQTIIQVQASDMDFGTNAEIEYHKLDGNGSSFVNVDSSSGMLTVASSVSGEAGKEFLVNVEARDHGIPALSSTTKVILKVAFVNLHTPQFTNDMVFHVTVPESQATGSIIATVSATDADGVDHENGQVSYFITGGDPLEQFTVDESGGWLRVNTELDYETVANHYLNMTARDRGLVPKETTRLFTVYLSDINDNPPEFDADVYDGFVEENAHSGTPVLNMNATDPDTTDNSIMAYSLSGPSQVLSIFTINDTTGVIRSQGPIDYEQEQQYMVTVQAVNPGTSLAGSTQVNINILGVNEFIPIFSSKDYEFVVSESAGPGSLVGIVTATDEDLGSDGAIHYYLVGDSNMRGFALDPDSGLLTIGSYVDREAMSEVTLDVLAKNDGPIHGNDTSMAAVRVVVRDANDPPQFTQSVYEAHSAENVPPQSSLVQVIAIDNDILPNDRTFTYQIVSGNEGSVFEIEQGTGWILSVTALDRETVDLYTLKIAAVDGGTPPQTGTTTVKLNIDDVNDNGPYFNPEIPVGHIIEEQEPYTNTIITLEDFTFDLDIVPQTPFVYLLKNHQNTFDVAMSTGQVKSKVRLDRETVSDYLVAVEVMDAGTPVMTSTLTFSVAVDDINDNPSISRPLDIQVYAYQGRFAAGKIADVKPLDADVTGSYSCDLTAGDVNIFSIPSSCDLHVAEILNMASHSITIRGSDGVHSTVDYPGQVRFSRFDEETMTNSVVMVLAGTTIKQFLDASYVSLLSVLDNVFPGEVLLFAMEEVEEETNINLFVAAQDTSGAYLSKGDVTQKILNNEDTIESSAGVQIHSVNEDPCSDVPCENGGVCSYEITRSEATSISEGDTIVFTSPIVSQNVHCACPSGFEGGKCDQPVDHCAESPCVNSATCVDHGLGNYTCNCRPEWTGVHCEEDINECQASPCKNGGSCHNTAGSYSCVCTAQYTGTHCEQALEPCGSDPCLHGSTCQANTDGSYTCHCSYGNRGENCEIRAQGYQTLSYLEYQVAINDQVNFMTIEFSTTSADDLLLYYPGGDGDFLSLEVIQGNVRLSFQIGQDPVVRVTVPKHVSDGNWYRVEADRNGKVGSVKVSDCPEDDFKCATCLTSDPTCFNQATGLNYQFMDTGPDVLYIAGVADMQTLLQRPGDVATHDFIGCLRDVVLSGVDLQSQTPIASNGITNMCVRSEEGVCVVDGAAVCENEAMCVDEWDTYRCSCGDGYTGDTCDQAVSSFSFSPGATVTYTQRESYRRDQQISQQSRRRRSADSHVISFTFVTKVKEGGLFYSKGAGGFMQLYVENGEVQYKTWSPGSTDENTLTVSKDVTDSNLHNLTFTIQGDTVTVDVDSTVEVMTLSGAVYDPLGLDMEALTLGAVPEDLMLPGVFQQDFEGCLDDLILDGEAMPLDGATERFEVTPTGDISYECGMSSGPSVHVAIIVICVFFGVVLIVILIVFFVIRRRRQKSKPATGGGHAKQNGSLSSKSNGPVLDKPGETDTHTGQDSGFGDQGETEETFIRQHIANQLSTANRNSSRTSRPDLVESDPTVMNLRPGDVVLENSGVFNEAYNEEPPEHYDIDNASSIAPSDLVDIVGHYRKYRTGNLQPRMPSSAYPHHKHPHSSRHHTSSPSSHPDSLTTVSRQSPISLSSHQSNSPHTVGQHVNNLNRHSPRVPNHGPVSNIPVQPSSLRSTPLSGISGLYPNSTSTTYSERPPVVNVPQPRPNSRIRQPITQLGLRSTPTMGLTVDDIHRMNTHSKASPNTMDALSSSSGDSPDNKINRTDFTHADLLDPVSNLPPESSSEESANDSFTCSEFEYDNDRMRNDFSNPHRLVPRLTRVDENEAHDGHRKYSPHGLSDSNKDDSFSTFFTSEDEYSSGKAGNKTLPQNALNLEYLLNWGPNFDKLVGVFHDIAQLPDAEANHRATPSTRPSSRGSPKPVSPYQKPPTPTYANPPTPTYSQSPTPTYAKPPTPTYSQSPTPTYSQSPTPTYSQSPTPTYSQSPSPVYSKPPTPTYPKPPTPSSPMPIIMEDRDTYSRQNGYDVHHEPQFENHVSEEYV